MSELRNTHGSLLAFISAVAEDLDIDVVNLDAISDEIELPEKDFIGLQGFSLSSSNDNAPLTSTAGMFTIATRNDTNNMRLMRYLDTVYSLVQPTQIIPFYSLDDEILLGDLKFKGVTRLMPVTRNGTMAVQSITFQASLQYVE